MDATQFRTNPMSHRTRVVLVDDNADVRRLLREQLELAGFAVVGEASDGDEAIRVTERLRPHVVVLDLEMGRMSGASALPGIRRAAPSCSVVVFSWFPDPFTLASSPWVPTSTWTRRTARPSWRAICAP